MEGKKEGRKEGRKGGREEGRDTYLFIKRYRKDMHFEYAFSDQCK